MNEPEAADGQAMNEAARRVQAQGLALLPTRRRQAAKRPLPPDVQAHTRAPDKDRTMQPLPDSLPAPMRAALHEAHALLHERYGARLRHLVLYGSQARGDAHDESDVDVLVVLDGALRRYHEVKQLVEVSMDLFNRFGYWISFKILPATDYEDPDHPLMTNIRREGVAL